MDVEEVRLREVVRSLDLNAFASHLNSSMERANQLYTRGNTPLHVIMEEATESNHVHVLALVGEVVRCGADVNRSTRGDRRSPLALAASKSFLAAVVKELILNGARVDQADSHEATPLYVAAKAGNVEVARVLIEEGKANVNHRCVHLETALHVAAECGHASVVRLLLDSGADRLQRCRSSRTPLALACIKNQIEIVKILVQKSKEVEKAEAEAAAAAAVAASSAPPPTPPSLIFKKRLPKVLRPSVSTLVNTLNSHSFDPDYVKSSLMQAVCHNHVEPTRILFELSALTSFEVFADALYNAADNGSIDVLRFLIARAKQNLESFVPMEQELEDEDVVDLTTTTEKTNKAINKSASPSSSSSCWHNSTMTEVLSTASKSRRRTALWAAANRGHNDALRMLVDVGALVDVNGESEPALYGAAEEGFIQCVETLLSYNANINAVHQLTQSSVLAAAAANGHDRIVIRLLKSPDIDIHAVNLDGMTALHSAKTVTIVRALVAAGCYVEARDNDNRTPLVHAILNNDDLDDSAADDEGEQVGSGSGGGVMMMLNTCEESVASVLLDEFNADSCVVCNAGRTPLHYAARRRSVALIRKLCEHGAAIVVEKLDDDGVTALFTAVRCGHVPIVSALCECANANANTQSKDGVYCLYIATVNQRADLIRELVKYGADVNAIGIYGMTALFPCIRYNLEECLVALLDAHADPTLTTIGGRSLLDELDKLTGASEVAREALRAQMMHRIRRYRCSQRVHGAALHVFRCLRGRLSRLPLLVLENIAFSLFELNECVLEEREQANVVENRNELLFKTAIVSFASSSSPSSSSSPPPPLSTCLSEFLNDFNIQCLMRAAFVYKTTRSERHLCVGRLRPYSILSLLRTLVTHDKDLYLTNVPKTCFNVNKRKY